MRPSRPLAQAKTVDDLANASRVALSEFIELHPHDSAGVLAWLRGPYRRAVSYASVDVVDIKPPFFDAEEVANAQRTAKRAIAAAWNASPNSLIGILPSFLDVVPVHDSSGARGFAPVDRPRRLATRALTLLLADYLTRPNDYVELIESVA